MTRRRPKQKKPDKMVVWSAYQIAALLPQNLTTAAQVTAMALRIVQEVAAAPTPQRRKARKLSPKKVSRRPAA
jgi:hypothetical protein